MDTNSQTPWSNRVLIWTHRTVDALKPMRVLVVDDNQNAAEALVAYLLGDHFIARAVFGGAQGVREAKTWRPHIIIMDISMPECNGYQAARALRQDSATSSIGIVAFTALDASEVRRHLSDQEFDAYCQKGQSPSYLSALDLEVDEHSVALQDLCMATGRAPLDRKANAWRP